MTISRRTFLASAGISLASTVGMRAVAQRAKPSIVLVMADDQGWGDMAYNGHSVLQTPHFDAMAAAATRFDRFYAAAPVCSPTRASVLTGRHPNRMSCLSWGHTIRPQEITIAEALKTAGYTTAHFGKWHIGSIQDGSPVNPGASGFDEWISAHNFFDNDPILSVQGTAKQFEGESSMVTVDAAIDFIRRKSKEDEPFLAVVWFGSPHNPHRAAEEDKKPYANEKKKFQDFYGEITGMDRAFGKLRNEIAELGIKDNTILWYCSDNGGLPTFGSTGGRADKGDIYEGGLRVPAMIEWPASLEPKSTISTPCNTSDIYPTLLDIVGAQMPKQPRLDGISLVPMLEGVMDSRPEGMGFWSYPAKGVSTPSATLMKQLMAAQEEGKRVAHPEFLRMDADTIKPMPGEGGYTGHAAWLDWPWKLHRIEEGGEEPRFELYNLDDDPMEATDLVTKNDDRTDTMRAALESWMDGVIASHGGADY